MSKRTFLLLALVCLAVLTGCETKHDLLPPKFAESEPIVESNAESIAESSAESVYDPREHPFLSGKDIGYCQTLTEKVHILFVWVDDALDAWDEAAKQSAEKDLNAGIETLKTKAEAHSVKLELTHEYLHTSIAGEAFEDSEAWKDEALRNAGYLDVAGTQYGWELEKGLDEVPIVFLLNRNGRPYAISRTGFSGAESVVLYASDTSAFVHELLHLFGAEDYYFTEEILDAATEHLPDSIMDEGSVFDDLTLYLIGWTGELTDSAEAFLRETDELTEEYLESERSEDQFTGYATIEWGGGTYTGYLLSGSPHGKGKLVWEDGSYYDGDWEGGYMHGEGVYAWPDGESYTGGFKSDLFHGYGVYVWPDGVCYEGDWFEDEMEGVGKMTFEDGSYYNGDWVDSYFHGEGEYVWANGDRYVGGFRRDVRHGYGVLTYADGTVEEGMWQNDRLVD